MDRLNNFLDKKPSLKGRPATLEEIKEAEKELEVRLDDDYKEFIQKFGGAFAGIAIHAFSNGSSIGKETMIELTKQGRKIAHVNKFFPALNKCYVIADDGSGNPIGINPKGQVILFDYDTGEETMLAESFELLIKDNFHEW